MNFRAQISTKEKIYKGLKILQPHRIQLISKRLDINKNPQFNPIFMTLDQNEDKNRRKKTGQRG